MEKLAIKNLILSNATDLTLSDRRLYNYLLLHAFNRLSKSLDFKIPMTELEGVYGAGLPPVERLKESLRRLLRTLVEFEDSSRRWIITSLLERAELDESEGRLYYSYPLRGRQLFMNPYTLERCLIQAHFVQKYSNFLYEILSEANYIKQTTVSLEIADLRGRLHIPDNKLSNYSDLERFALAPALNEINSYAGFAVKFHTKRKGMKVTHVIFEITRKGDLFNIEDVKKIIPPKRPRLFIDDPQLERAYAYLLNAETKERRKFFDLALKLASKKKITIDEDEFDRPDLWFRWVEHEVLKKSK